MLSRQSLSNLSCVCCQIRTNILKLEPRLSQYIHNLGQLNQDNVFQQISQAVSRQKIFLKLISGNTAPEDENMVKYHKRLSKLAVWNSLSDPSKVFAEKVENYWCYLWHDWNTVLSSFGCRRNLSYHGWSEACWTDCRCLERKRASRTTIWNQGFAIRNMNL